MGKDWNPGDAFRRCFTGRLRSYLATTFAAMSLRDWVGTPRAVSLRVVDAYRRGSALEQRCGRSGPSCSTLGRAYIARYGAVQGWTLALWVIATCSAEYSEDPCAGPGRSGGSCCPG